jgi:hypothetical protein
MSALESVNWAAVCAGGVALWVVLFLGFRVGFYKGFAKESPNSVEGDSSVFRPKRAVSRYLFIAGISLFVALCLDVLQNIPGHPIGSITRAAVLGVLGAAVAGLPVIVKALRAGRSKEYSPQLLTISCATVASSLVIYLVQR